MLILNFAKVLLDLITTQVKQKEPSAKSVSPELAAYLIVDSFHHKRDLRQADLQHHQNAVDSANHGMVTRLIDRAFPLAGVKSARFTIISGISNFLIFILLQSSHLRELDKMSFLKYLVCVRDSQFWIVTYSCMVIWVSISVALSHKRR